MRLYMIKFLCSIIFIAIGYKILLDKELYGRGSDIDLSSPFLHYPLGIVFILIGSFLIISIFYERFSKYR